MSILQHGSPWSWQAAAFHQQPSPWLWRSLFAPYGWWLEWFSRPLVDDLTTLTTTKVCTRHLLDKVTSSRPQMRITTRLGWIPTAAQTIDNTLLPARLKLCLQFSLLPHLMCPLIIYQIPLTKVEMLEWLVSFFSFAKKWIGLLRCITLSALYRKGAQKLPGSSLNEECRYSKSKAWE